MLLLALWHMGTATAQEPYAWEAMDPVGQVHADRVVVPDGQGAVFIPRMTEAGSEPLALLVDDGEVRTVPIGEKIPLDEGRYVVLVGSAGPERAVGVPVEVEAGQVTLVPVEWGGLSIEVVNPRLQVVEHELELVRVDTGERVQLLPELVSGAERPDTWLVEPGLYRVQRPGSEGSLRPDFTTVYVPEGGLASLRVFVDRAGRLKSAAVVDPTGGLEEDERGPWSGSLVLGVSGSLTQQQNVVGRQDFALAEGGVWLDGHVDFLSKRHQLSLDVHGEEGALFVQPATGKALPWIKSQDELRAELAYTFLLNEGAGIYARGGASAQLLPTRGIAAEPLTVVYEELDGSQRTVEVDAADTYSLNDDYFNPLAVRMGTGLRSRLSTHRDVELALYAGAGGRIYRMGGAYLPDDDDATEALEVRAIPDFELFGPEIGADVGIRINGFASYEGGVEWFAPVDQLDEFIVESGHSLSLRITRALSVSYRVDVSRVPQITDQWMLRQGLSLRLGWEVI